MALTGRLGTPTSRPGDLQLGNPGVAGVSNTITVSTTQSLSVSIAKVGLTQRVVSTAQFTGLRLLRGVTLRRAVTQAQSVSTQSVAQHVYTRAVTQAQSVALISGRTFLRLFAITQSQSLALARATSLQRTATQAIQVGLRGGSSRTLAITQATTVRLVRFVRFTRAVLQPQDVSSGLGRGVQRVVATTQSTSVRLQKALQMTRSMTGSHRVSQHVSLAGSPGRLVRATQATSVRLLKQVRLRQTVPAGQAALPLGGIPVKLRVVSTVQTRSLALGRAVTLTRWLTQATVLGLQRVLHLAPSVAVPTVSSRVQNVSLTRVLAQATAVSLDVRNVTPRSFITLRLTVGQHVSLSSAGTGKTGKGFIVSVRDATFAVGHRNGDFAVRRRGVRFTVEER